MKIHHPLALLFVILLSGCSVPTAIEMADNPRLLKIYHQKCAELESSDPLESVICPKVVKAYSIVFSRNEQKLKNKKTLEPLDSNGE